MSSNISTYIDTLIGQTINIIALVLLWANIAHCQTSIFETDTIKFSEIRTDVFKDTSKYTGCHKLIDHVKYPYGYGGAVPVDTVCDTLLVNRIVYKNSTGLVVWRDYINGEVASKTTIAYPMFRVKIYGGFVYYVPDGVEIDRMLQFGLPPDNSTNVAIRTNKKDFSRSSGQKRLPNLKKANNFPFFWEGFSHAIGVITYRNDTTVRVNSNNVDCFVYSLSFSGGDNERLDCQAFVEKVSLLPLVIYSDHYYGQNLSTTDLIFPLGYNK